MDEKKNCTVTEAAKILNLTEYTVRKKIREGEIKAIRGKSDREGYRIPFNELVRYAQNNGRSENLVEFGFVGAFLGMGFTKILEEANNIKRKKNSASDYEKIKELSIESIKDEIEATQYYIQALEIDGDKMSKEDKKRVLEGKAKIKLLERQIKEIELKDICRG